jgi:hypothetical protein
VVSNGISILGHVAIAEERYVLMSKEERMYVWRSLIRKLNIPEGTAYLPVPYYDPATMTHGMNIVGLGGTDD